MNDEEFQTYGSSQHERKFRVWLKGFSEPININCHSELIEKILRFATQPFICNQFDNMHISNTKMFLRFSEIVCIKEIEEKE